MDKALVALIMFGGIALLIGLVVILVFWYESIGNTPKIKLSSFLKFYSINPDRWHLCDDGVLCKRLNGTFDYVGFHFGLIDFCIYKLWYKALGRRERKQTQLQYTAKMIEAVKHDIHAIECLSREEIEQAKKDISNIFGLMEDVNNAD